MLATLINKWIRYDGTANLQAIFSEITKINDYSMVIKVYMELYKKHKHAQKRYLLFKLLDHLLANFANDIGHHVMEILMEVIDLAQVKLLPKEWSNKLKELAFESLEKWIKEYPQYRAFKIAHQHILDLHDGDRSRIFFPKEEIPQNLMQVYDRSFESIFAAYGKAKEELDEIQQKLETSIELLLQTQDLLFEERMLSKNSKGSGLPEQKDIHRYGLGSSSYNLNVSIDLNTLDLTETDENAVLFQEIRENLIEKKYAPDIAKWSKKVSKIQMNQVHQEFLKQLIHSKSRLDQILINVRNLGISWNRPRSLIPQNNVELEEDEDEEFLMVTNEDDNQYSNQSKMHDLNQSSSQIMLQESDAKPIDASVESGCESLADQSGELPHAISEEKAELLKKAPVVKYDEDLEYWDKVDVPFNTSGLEFQHRFLGAGSGDRFLSQDTLQKLKMRTISLPMPSPPTIQRSCNAPLKNGNLCQRKDLVKCPIHGMIIERDSDGNPLDETIQIEPDNIPEWQKFEDLVNRAHPMEKRKSQIEDINKKSSKQRIDSKLARDEKKRGASEAFEANLKLRERQAFKW